MNFIIIRNPQFRLFPGFIRRALGEEYLTVNTTPGFTNDFALARVFPSYDWAASYIYDRNGKLRPYAAGCVIRATGADHSIPTNGDNETS